MNNDILHLLETKNFDELTPEERSLVLDEMSETEYREQHHLILTIFEIEKEEKINLTPHPQTLILAKEKLSQKKKGGFLFLQHKIPTWMAAAACLLIYLGLKSIHHSVGTPQEIITTETIYDTVYQEKIIVEQLPADTIIKYITIEPSEIIPAETEHATYSSMEDPNFDHLYFREDPFCQIMSCYESKKGNPAANDTWLKLSQEIVYP